MEQEKKVNDVSQLGPEVSKFLEGEFSKFIQDFDEEELKPETQPSIISKGGTKTIDIKQLDPKQIEEYLFVHPVMPRGIDMKANRMVNRGFTINAYDNSKLAKDAADYCIRIIENSGNETFIKRWIKDAYAFGNGYWTLVPNKLNDAIIKLNPEHPVFFRPMIYPGKDGVAEWKVNGDSHYRFKINPNTKEISEFTQVQYGSYDKNTFVPFGKPIPRNQVAHLMFDRWGDEAVGISVVQTVQLTLKYLLNLEEAGAERMWRDGFTQKKVTTEITNDRDLKKLAKNIAGINVKDTIILPKGTDVENLLPGTSDFPRFHQIFMKILAIRLGLPQPLLLQDGTSTNKATLDEMRKDITADFLMDELIVEQTITNDIFRNACELKFGKNFDKIPSFYFNEMAEDEDAKVERFLKTSEAINNMSNALKNLSQAGIDLNDERVLQLVNYLAKSVEDAETLKPKKINLAEKKDESGRDKEKTGKIKKASIIGKPQ